MKHRIVLALVCLLPVLSMAQSVVVHEQVNFPEQIPAGGYSGITWLGEDRYAVVTDNAAHDGFFVFRIQIDSLGCIVDVSNDGFRGNDDKGHDKNYWRGLTWLNVAYFAVRGLYDYGYVDTAREIKEYILNMCYDLLPDIFENYDSLERKGCGCEHFSWSSAFIIEFILEIK